MLDAFRPIPNSAAAPCDMQKEVAAHNSAYDTLKHSKLAVYKAPCDVDPKPAPKPKPKPKPTKPAVS